VNSAAAVVALRLPSASINASATDDASHPRVELDDDDDDEELDELDDDEDELDDELEEEEDDDDDDDDDELDEVEKLDDDDSTERLIFGVAMRMAVSETILQLSPMTNVFWPDVTSSAANDACQRRTATFFVSTTISSTTAFVLRAESSNKPVPTICSPRYLPIAPRP